MKDILNPYQKASLATVLRMFEENLRQAESWLDGRQIEGIMYRQELALSASQRAEARQRIAEALAEIAALARQIGLEPAAEDPAGLICGQMSLSWANLIDSQASKLKRYGDVHPEAAQEIDPPIRRLAKFALELAVLFGNSKSNPAEPDAEKLIEE